MDAFSSDIRSPQRPKSPPLVLFDDIFYDIILARRTSPKPFLKALRRQYLLILKDEGERAPKKDNFWTTFSKKCTNTCACKMACLFFLNLQAQVLFKIEAL